MDLTEAFDIRKDEVISLVGGGGKTTLMFALAREIALNGHKVITTTTTRIAADEPDKFNSPLLLQEDEDILISSLSEYFMEFNHVTVAKNISPEGDKLIGYSPEVIDRVASFGLANIIIEADGARGKPIKAPNTTEPVIPASTTLVIQIVGMDALGVKLNEDNTFRPEVISDITGLKIGEPITEDTIATLITHPQGVAKGTPATARTILLLNKVDKSNIAAAESIARQILSKDKRMQKVVLGQLTSDEPVVAFIPKK